MPTDQLARLLRTLSIRQRWTTAVVVVMVAAGVFAFSRWEREAGFRPLYNGLSPEDAGMVVQKLKENGTPYRLLNNGATIAVPDEKVAELRLEMAGAGLPKNGRIGFELFDKTNFGITEFAEHVNYRRALEGELERSVMSVAAVEQARVHISLPQESVFTEARQPAKASVLVKIHQGASLPETAIPAITNLVASAVEGLTPDNVSVLDMRGNLLNRPRRAGTASDESSSSALEYRHKVEQDLTAKLDSTLEPLIGAGRFRTAVSAECDMTSGEQSEETFDPTHSVMASSQKTEDVSSQAHPASGIPGTASTLPDTNPRPASVGGTTSRKTESINYQSAHTVKRTVLPQGAIRRLSVSVLIDHDVHWEANGTKRVLVPPAPERLKVIHDLVAAAAGLNTQRGDQLIVESLPFESTMNLDAPESSTPVSGAPKKKLTPVEQIKSDPKLMMGLAGIVIVVVGGSVFAISKMRGPKSGTASRPVEVRVPDALPQASGSAMERSQRVDSGEIRASEPASAIHSLVPGRVEVLTTQVRATAQRNSEVCAGVLRGWLKEERV
jgi:flagellar M-ring protein FliF